MKHWESKAIKMLKKSFFPLPQELNEIDWKTNLSDNSEKFAQHLSAFANYHYGGFIVFGINDKGVIDELSNETYTEIIKKVGNIARNNLEHPLRIDHAIVNFENKNILVFYIEESAAKPVNLRGKTINDTYIRSAGQSRKATKQEIQNLLRISSNVRFEEEVAMYEVETEQILRMIDYVSYFELMGKNLPDNKNAIIDNLLSEKIIYRNKDRFDITNLGAILFAKNLKSFETLERKAVRVVIYEGKDRTKTRKEQLGQKGYANGFGDLISYIIDQLPQNEILNQALRQEVKIYPSVAVRELVANALIHQDFYAIGTGPMIEIFSDRVEINNPGRPLINVIRFIDSPPQSRNELLASFMRRLKICEERGSGIDKVIFEIELFQLPAPNFIDTDTHTIATLYSPKNLGEMDKSDRVRACYQHCCLKYVSNEKMSNQTLRKRFNILDQNYPMASRIITDTMNEGLIKLADPDNASKKYFFYIPFWA